MFEPEQYKKDKENNELDRKILMWDQEAEIEHVTFIYEFAN